MKENLSFIFTKFSGLKLQHKIAVGGWIGSWAARTSLWPLTIAETYLRLKAGGADVTLSSVFAAAAPSIQSYAVPWVILKTTQWGSMGYLGTEIVRSFMPVKKP